LQGPRRLPLLQHPAQAAEIAAHLVDHVLPSLPVRQWVLSLPKRLRYHIQRDREALNSSLRVFLDEIERHLRAHSPGAGTEARAGAVAFIHRFGSSLNLHTHFHVCVIDGIFEPDPDHGVRFIAVDELDADDAAAVQRRVRQRILRAFVRSGILDKDERRDMEQWSHGGGFSLDATVRIEANDRRGLERLLRYCARPPFAAERIEELDRHRLIYHLPKPGPHGRTQLILSPLELASSASQHWYLLRANTATVTSACWPPTRPCGPPSPPWHQRR
jgi:hypothetical protein